MVHHLKALPPTRGYGSLTTCEAMRKLGLDVLPDPGKHLNASVENKLLCLRNLFAHGKDPLKDNAVQRAKKGTYNWRGMLEDAGAVLGAGPGIAPLLDRRPDPLKRDAPRWRQMMASMRSQCPELESTGLKRGRHLLLRYNEQVAEELAACKDKAPKRRTKGLPYLGKEQ